MRLILSILILTLIPLTSFAAEDEAISYKFITSMMTVSENFTLTLYDKLTASFESLFTKLAIITLIIHALRWQLGKPDIVNLLKFFFTLAAVKTIAFTPGVFEEWFYTPVISTMYALPAFVIKVSSGNLNYGSDLDAIKSMLASMDKTIKTMRLIGELIMDEKGFWSSTWIFIQGMFLNIVYTGLYIVFVVMFTVGVVASHVMLAAAPFAISLIAFETPTMDKNLTHSYQYLICNHLLNISFLTYSRLFSTETISH